MIWPIDPAIFSDHCATMNITNERVLLARLSVINKSKHHCRLKLKNPFVINKKPGKRHPRRATVELELVDHEPVVIACDLAEAFPGIKKWKFVTPAKKARGVDVVIAAPQSRGEFVFVRTTAHFSSSSPGTLDMLEAQDDSKLVLSGGAPWATKGLIVRKSLLQLANRTPLVCHAKHATLRNSRVETISHCGLRAVESLFFTREKAKVVVHDCEICVDLLCLKNVTMFRVTKSHARLSLCVLDNSSIEVSKSDMVVSADLELRKSRWVGKQSKICVEEEVLCLDKESSFS